MSSSLEKRKEKKKWTYWYKGEKVNTDNQSINRLSWYGRVCRPSSPGNKINLSMLQEAMEPLNSGFEWLVGGPIVCAVINSHFGWTWDGSVDSSMASLLCGFARDVPLRNVFLAHWTPYHTHHTPWKPLVQKDHLRWPIREAAEKKRCQCSRKVLSSLGAELCSKDCRGMTSGRQ